MIPSRAESKKGEWKVMRLVSNGIRVSAKIGGLLVVFFLPTFALNFFVIFNDKKFG